MANVQQQQIELQKAILQQSFLTEKELLLKREKSVEDEKKKLQRQLQEEQDKANALKDEQELQLKVMEEERMKLQAVVDEAVKKQKEAEAEMTNKQKKLETFEMEITKQERLLGEENRKLIEKLQNIEIASKQAAAKKKETQVQTDKIPEEQVVTATQKTAFNGSEADAAKKAEDSLTFDGIREKIPAARLHEIGVLTKKEFDKLKKGKMSLEDFKKTDKIKICLEGLNCVGGVLTPSKDKMSIYQAIKEKKINLKAATMLLEAQAACGYIVDPVENKLLSVDEAVKAELLGPELHSRMLYAEQAATGFKNPYYNTDILAPILEPKYQYLRP